MSGLNSVLRVAAASLVLGFALAAPAFAQKVKLATSMGDIVIQLDAQRAPKSAANFVEYVKAGHYNGTVFHRVIDNFMIQGGGMTVDMTEKPVRAPIALESQNGLRHQRGTLAMARTMDPNSATAQFFINVKDNDFLNFSSETPRGWGYAVFGNVIQGMDVVDRIKAVRTANRGMHQNVPVEPVIINKATLEN